MTNELETIFPTGKQVNIGEETLNITPFKLGQINKVLKAAEPMFVVFKTVDTNGTDEEVGSKIITELLLHCGDSIRDILAISVNKSVEWVDELEADKVIELLSVIFEVNKDFFIQKVLPMLKKVRT